MPAPLGDVVEAYERLLCGLWLSGLRLGEALNLRWDDTSEAMSLHVDGRNSVFRIPGGTDKSKKARICPTVPDFVEFIAPMQEARGNVFPGIAGDVDHVSKRICKMGKKAGVWFDNGKAASAHDLRRSMATRWANLVSIFILKELMRHADISTTQKYYLGKDAAKATAFDAVQPPKTGGNVPKVSQSEVLPELKALFEQ
ncbi:MAG: site-specific integrase [Planctomycetaceae bacterium]|nr:site-specific integrase [Planctomycetaceae bacterium]